MLYLAVFIISTLKSVSEISVFLILDMRSKDQNVFDQALIRAAVYVSSLLSCNLIFDLLSQMVDEQFDIKEKVQKLLAESDYDKKRARTMDMDDFLG